MIESAQYVADENGDDVSVNITMADGSVASVPVNGTTWMNTALQEWQENGGEIAPA